MLVILDGVLLRSLLSQKTVSGTFLGIWIVCLNLGQNWSYEMFPVTAFACSGLFGQTGLIAIMWCLPNSVTLCIRKSLINYLVINKIIFSFTHQTGAVLLFHCALMRSLKRGRSLAPLPGHPFFCGLLLHFFFHLPAIYFLF